jgi:2-oxoglutarate ferredoxin oxidoreductase subunit alpha
METELEPMVEIGHCDDAEIVVVAFGTPGKFVRYCTQELRAQGVKVGFVRPITLHPFPSQQLRAAVQGAKTVAVYENSAGQMVDDVRLSVLGDVPVDFIGGLTMDSSAFGVGPDLQVPIITERILGAARRANVESLGGLR